MARGRAAQGSGTIRQRPDGRWEARFTTGRDPGTGKQVQRSVYGKTQKEVRQKLQQIAVEIDNGTYITPSKLTVAAWTEIWLREYVQSSVKDTTYRRYEESIRLHIVKHIGAVQLRSLNGAQIQRFYNSVKKDTVKHPNGLSPKSMRNLHSVLHSCLERACILGFISVNPSNSCVLPRVERKEIKPFDLDDLCAFMNAVVGHKLEKLFVFDLFSGLRRGEILALQWRDVDFDTGAIYVSKQLQRERKLGGKWRFVTLKNDKARTVTLAPSVMQILKDRRKQQITDKLRAANLWNEGDFAELVFTNEFGGHLDGTSVWRHFKRIVTQIGMPEARFHDLRHSYAMNSLRAGDDLRTVQENLGHHSPGFTLATYAHSVETMKRESANRMESFYQQVKKGI